MDLIIWGGVEQTEFKNTMAMIRIFVGNSQIALEKKQSIGYNKLTHFGGGCQLRMKNLSLLIWLTQLGFSVAFPLAGFILLAVWLRERFALGGWIIWAGIAIGGICAADGLRTSLKAMERLAKDKKDDVPPPVSFNDHD